MQTTIHKKKFPVRLMLHIGSGKTGTSSIRHTLCTNQEELKSRGIWYLGTMLEYASSIIYPWQKLKAVDGFHLLDKKTAETQLRNLLELVLEHAISNNLHTIIWVNETFFRRGERVAAVLKSLPIDVSIIAYIRRHDTWAKSAYVQWGIKHKNNIGRILSFDEWIKANPDLLTFSKYLNQWINIFADAVKIRNLDKVVDSVDDFMKIIGFNLNQLIAERKNESPPIEELLLRALFNDKFAGPVGPTKFNQILLGRTGWMNITTNEFMQSLLPDQEKILALDATIQADRSALNQMLAKNGQSEIETSQIDINPPQVDFEKLLLNISRIVVDQSMKIQSLRREIDQLKTEKSFSIMNSSENVDSKDFPYALSEQPVFVISTGRSGSTLVQRLLNCHKDLVVWGEHFGFLRGFRDIYAIMANPSSSLYPRTAAENKGPNALLPTLKNPAVRLEWANPWSLEEFSVQIRNFINGYFGSRLSDGQRWGFKEILYNDIDTLRMFHQIYPNGKFIFIQRNIIDVARSKILSFIKKEKWENFSHDQKNEELKIILNKIKEDYASYQKFIDEFPDSGLIIQYEEIIENFRNVLKKMFSHLNMDLSLFDWNLADQIMKKVLSKTERSEELLDLIRLVHKTQITEGDVNA